MTVRIAEIANADYVIDTINSQVEHTTEMEHTAREFGNLGSSGELIENTALDAMMARPGGATEMEHTAMEFGNLGSKIVLDKKRGTN